MRDDREMLDIVHRRARQLRTRRRLMVGSVAATLILVVVVVAVVAGRGGHSSLETVDTARRPPSRESSTSTTAAGPTVVGGDSTTSSSLGPTGSATNVRPGASIPATTPTAVPSPTTTTTSPLTSCTVGEVSSTVTTDQSSYRQGEAIQVTVSARNGSDRACDAVATYRLTVTAADGTVVDTQGVGLSLPVGADWAPGTTQTWTFTWDQRACAQGPGNACTGSQVPPGIYALAATAGAFPASGALTIS